MALAALREACVAVGFIALLAALPRQPAWWPAVSARLSLAGLSLLAATAIAEVAGRAVRFDFRHQEALLQQTPPFWRLPRVPTGTVFFRREGNLAWTGQVIRHQLERSGFAASASAYADEPVASVRYDPLGFRNEPRPDAWEIAVAGDSFTELGAVATEDLFTTILGRRLGCRVLNLGVGGTGPLSYLSYLEDYGLSPATRQVVAVFFEGNDLDNLRDERRAELRFATTGRRDFRPIRPQTSLLQALGEWLAEPRLRPQPPEAGVDGYFLGRRGEIPVTLGLPPEGREALDAEVAEALGSFMRRYGVFAREHKLCAWLAYMPAKARVLAGQVRLTPNAVSSLAGWQPTDLPEVIAAACAAEEIRFINLTPALVARTQREGELLYNPLIDSHLNALGSRVVGETLAEALCASCPRH